MESRPRCQHEIMKKDPQGTLGPRYQVARLLFFASVAALRFVVDTSQESRSKSLPPSLGAGPNPQPEVHPHPTLQSRVRWFDRPSDSLERFWK